MGLESAKHEKAARSGGRTLRFFEKVHSAGYE